MEVLRFLSLVSLGLWVGGLAVLGGVVAPGLFDMLGAADSAGGRDQAARLFGEILNSFLYVSWALGGMVVTSLGLRAALGPRPRRLAIRLWTTGLMVAASVVTASVISPRIDAIREATAGPVSGLAPTDPARVNFGRLHGASTGLLLLTVIAGVGLMWTEARDRD